MRNSSHEQRITALETRVEENERSFSETQYKHFRSCVRTDLNVATIMRHLNLETATDEQVDATLDGL